MFRHPLARELGYTKWQKLSELEKEDSNKALSAYRGFMGEMQDKQTTISMEKFKFALARYRKTETEMAPPSSNRCCCIIS
jgi:hypothetical protein